jgi:hypothetical protein
MDGQRGLSAQSITWDTASQRPDDRAPKGRRHDQRAVEQVASPPEELQRLIRPRDHRRVEAEKEAAHGYGKRPVDHSIHL